MYETLLHMNAHTHTFARINARTNTSTNTHTHTHTHTHTFTFALTYTSFLHMTRRRKKIYNIAEEKEKISWLLSSRSRVMLLFRYNPLSFLLWSRIDVKLWERKERRKKWSEKSGVFLCSFCFVLTHFFHHFHFELDFDLSWNKNLNCDFNERMESGWAKEITL
jgi:hypothetical protein